ncbi:MAG: serine/threonine protein kinase [Gemmatimonadota bacterium]|nr:serine/threonine protein kinase [Gemmatimonadota bacterium]
MTALHDSNDSTSVRLLDETEQAAFATAAAQAVAEELRTAIAPGIQLLRPLGAGAMGLVFLARDPLLKRLVAIKVLAPHLAGDAVAHARFIRESEASAALMHPNIAGIYLVGELPQSRTPYYVMQFIDGRSLAEVIADGSAFSDTRAKRLVGEIASALEAAHAHGVVHRDVKPANIIIERDSDRPVVLDFGISAVLQREEAPGSPKLTAIGTYLGTPTYMSPEQATGEPVTGQSDVYGLGLIAFELLTGHPPFDGAPMVVMAAHVERAPPSLHAERPGIDSHLAELVERCLRKNPAERPTAADVAQSLVPASRSLLEWPPPGLETIRGRGAKLGWQLGLMCFAILLFFVLLHMRPTLGSPQWVQGEQSVWSAVFTPPDPMVDARSDRRFAGAESVTSDATPVWMFLVSASVALLFGFAIFVIWQTVRFAREVRHAALGRYPWSVVFDTAWDRSRDTSSLLNGSGVYALYSPEGRERLLRNRRVFAIASLVIAALALLVPLLWLAGALGSRHSAVALVTDTELAIISLPLLLGAIVLTFLDRSSRMPSHRHASTSRAPFQAELVAAWLKESGRGVPVHAPRTRGLLAALAPAVTAVVLLTVLYVVQVVFFVVLVTTQRLSTGRATAEQLRTAMRADSTRPMPFSELDSIARRSGSQAVGSAPDTAAAYALLAQSFLRVRDSVPTAMAGDTAAAAALNRSSPLVSLPRADSTALADTVLPPLATLEPLARVAQTPWLDIWQRFAASPDYPLMWQYRTGMPGVKYPWTVPVMRPGSNLDFARRNAIMGEFELARGDVVGATRRARANIAAGRHLMHSTNPSDDSRGLAIMGVGEALLGVIARTTHDATLHEEVTRIHAARTRWRTSPGMPAGLFAMVADPESREAITYLKQLESPTHMAGLFQLAMGGFCSNSREIFFGISPERAELVHAVAVASGDPRASELEALALRGMTDINAGTADMGAPSPAALAPLRWLGMRGVSERMGICLSRRGPRRR